MQNSKELVQNAAQSGGNGGNHLVNIKA
jgi:hypothetical protein